MQNILLIGCVVLPLFWFEVANFGGV